MQQEDDRGQLVLESEPDLCPSQLEPSVLQGFENAKRFVEVEHQPRRDGIAVEAAHDVPDELKIWSATVVAACASMPSTTWL